MIKLDEIVDLKRMVVLAVVAVLVFLSILVGSTVNQLSWNRFQHQFAPNGYATKLDNKFVVGVEEIIRGEEANKLLESLSPYNPKPGEGNEIVLIKLKVQNTYKWTANLNIQSQTYGLQYPYFTLYTKGADWHEDPSQSIDLDLIDQGKYRNLNMRKVFESGEIRDGLFGFEIPKGKVLQKLSFGYYFSSSGEIPLEPTPITKKDLNLIAFWAAYLLSVLTLLSSCRQRQRKSRYSGLRFVTLYFFVFWPLLFLDIANSTDTLTNKILIGYTFLMILLMILGNLFRRKLIMQFSFLSKEALAGIIKDFSQQMQWVNPKIIEWKRKVEVQNPETKEVYIFDREIVYVKKPTSDQKMVKEILLDLFCETRFDWYTFFGFIFQYSAMCIVFYFYFFKVFF